MGTGLFVGVKRGRTFAQAEIETLTDEELHDLLRRASAAQLRAYCMWLAQWIRMRDGRFDSSRKTPKRQHKNNLKGYALPMRASLGPVSRTTQVLREIFSTMPRCFGPRTSYINSSVGIQN
jgi:hypothetical protein